MSPVKAGTACTGKTQTSSAPRPAPCNDAGNEALVIPYVIFGAVLVLLALLIVFAPETAAGPDPARPGARSG